MKKTIKTLFSVCIAILTFFCSVAVSSESEFCLFKTVADATENSYYSISGDGTLTVYGSGAMTNYTDAHFAPWGSKLSSIKKVIISEGITSIGNYSFNDCSNITEVVLPESLASIGKYAFSRCMSLSVVSIPSSVSSISEAAFKNCQSLEHIEIPESVTSVDREAFRWCSSLTYAYIGCKNLGVAAFANCTNLKDVTISDTVKNISGSAFEKSDNLANVYYNGTAKQWQAINIDSLGNTSLIGAKKTYAAESFDLTVQPGDFQALSGKRVYDSNTYVYSEYIFGDVYVREGVTVIFHNTTISGSVYVYGGAFFHGCNIGKMYASQFAYTYFEVNTSTLMQTLPNGYAKINNTQTGVMGTMYELYDVPCRIYEAVNVDGQVYIKGATLNLANLYLNDYYIPVSSVGLFSVNGLPVDKNANSVTLTWQANAGTVTKTLKLDRAVKNEDGTYSYYPEITPEVDSLNVCQGQTLNLNSLVSVIDKEDGKITEGITYQTDYNENSPVGRYKVIYSVSDSNNLISELSMTISVKAHKWSQISSEPAQCTSDGVAQFECSNCKTTKKEPITALGHNYENTVVYPTCTEEGYTTHTCTRCNDTYTDSKVKALGHSYKDIVTAPTCTKEGYTTHTCTRCNDTYTDSKVKVLGHSYKNTVTAPTCTKEGYTTHTCTRCNDTYTDSKVKALGHSYKDTVTAPTCTKEGYTTHTCTRCNDTYTDSKVKALGHSYKDTVTAPTCTKEGYTTHTCTRCSNTYTDTKVNATGHKWGEWKETLAPTATANGKEERSCTLCKKTESRATDKLSFNIGDLDENGKITAADARIALRASVGLETLSETQRLSADVDNNSKITAADARLILRASVGLEDLKKYKK